MCRVRAGAWSKWCEATQLESSSHTNLPWPRTALPPISSEVSGWSTAGGAGQGLPSLLSLHFPANQETPSPPCPSFQPCLLTVSPCVLIIGASPGWSSVEGLISLLECGIKHPCNKLFTQQDSTLPVLHRHYQFNPHQPHVNLALVTQHDFPLIRKDCEGQT